jgi:hypothetical protein
MQHFQTKLLTLTLPLAAVLALSACADTNKDVQEQASVVEMPDGAAIVDTISTSATVTAVDAPNRKLTLTLPDGKRTTVKCGPEVANFDQIKVNDRVNAAVTEELAVFLGHGSPPDAAAASAVVLAPAGAKPGGLTAQTVEITARIAAVDPGKRKVTLELPDGSKKTVKAGKQIDLSSIKAGDNVTVQHTEAVAITVEKP